MSPSGADTKSVRRVLLILWVAFVWTLAVYGIVMMVIRPQPTEAGPLRAVMLAFAGTTTAAALYFRLGRIGRLLSKATPLSDTEFSQLRTNYIVCFALSEAVALYGLVLHFLGSNLAEVGPFFAASVALLLICFPRLPA